MVWILDGADSRVMDLPSLSDREVGDAQTVKAQNEWKGGDCEVYIYFQGLELGAVINARVAKSSA